MTDHDIVRNVPRILVWANNGHAVWLVVRNDPEFPTRNFKFGDDRDNSEDELLQSSYDLIKIHANVSAGDGLRFRKTLSAAVICTMDDDQTDEYRTDPDYLNVNVIAVWLFDSSTGKIYSKITSPS